MAITVMVTPCRSILLLVLCVCAAYFVVSGYMKDLREVRHTRSLDDEITTNTRKNFEMVPGNSYSHLHWFVQISDLHLSTFNDDGRTEDLLKFCTENLNVIKPEVVLVTGDLTDSKFADKQGSKQFEEEWRQYNNVLNQSGIVDKTMWLDIRGNHDSFDVPSLTSSKNYFSIYSVSGRHNLRSRSYQYIHKTSDGDKFSFIAVDSVPIPGPRRPFNFFGIINKILGPRRPLNFFGIIKQEEIGRIEGFVDSTPDVTQRIFFGHYPTSTINYPHHVLREVLGKGIAYLSGHLHTLGGLVPRMYAMQQSGYLELELGDWKDGRLYRLIAVDHGLMSFIDTDLNSWPVILITNPKPSQFFVPKHENINQIHNSTHIRILVFSKAESIQSVLVDIDGVELGVAQRAEGPLYVLQWNPALYDNESEHTIRVHAVDSDGNKRSVSHKFSLHPSLPRFGFIRRFILMTDHTSLLQMIFFVFFTCSVLPLLLIKVFQVRINMVAHSRVSSCILKSAQDWLRRFYVLATTPRVYYPLLAYNFYLLVGPWFIGEVLKGHIGACFLYGVFVTGVWVPCSLTYFFGATQLLIFNITLALYLSHTLDRVRSSNKDHSASCCAPKNFILRWIYHHWVFVFIVTIQIYLVVAGIYKSYGVMAMALCPMRTWAVVLAVYLRYEAVKPYVAPASPRADADRLVASS